VQPSAPGDRPPEDRAPFATKSDLAYTRVRALILSGELEPGAVLPQATLARTIGISTTPLREALRRLRQEGLVSLDAHRDARVAPLDAKEARELVELRQSLDPLAASLAATRRTEDELAQIVSVLAGLESLSSHPSLEQLEHHRRFHAAIYRAAHNTLLTEALDGLWDKSDRYRLRVLEDARDEADRARSAEEHRLLFEAVRNSDSEAAADVMRRHVAASLGARAAERLTRDDHRDGGRNR
jgi:DNA-binding GntR family transcriptional regulator